MGQAVRQDGLVVTGGAALEPEGYAELLKAVKARVRTSQVRAVRAANSEVLALYWSVGRYILDRQARAGWGAKVVDRCRGAPALRLKVLSTKPTGEMSIKSSYRL